LRMLVAPEEVLRHHEMIRKRLSSAERFTAPSER
jgi:hypothetical protein